MKTKREERLEIGLSWLGKFLWIFFAFFYISTYYFINPSTEFVNAPSWLHFFLGYFSAVLTFLIGIIMKL